MRTGVIQLKEQLKSDSSGILAYFNVTNYSHLSVLFAWRLGAPIAC